MKGISALQHGRPTEAHTTVHRIEEALDLGSIYRIILRNWFILMGAALLCGGVGYAISSIQTPLYTTTATIWVTGGNTPGLSTVSDFQSSQELAINLVDLINARHIREEVSETLGVDIDSMRGDISVRTPRSLIAITASSTDPGFSAALANTTAQVFIEDFQTRQFSQIARFQATLSQHGIEQTADIVAAQAATFGALSIVDDALPPSQPSSPRIRLNTFLGAAIGLFLASAMVVFRERTFDKLRSADEIRAIADLTVFATLDRYPSASNGHPAGTHPTLTRAGTSPRENEAYRFLQTSLEFTTRHINGPIVILITSPNPGEGKTTVASNLAISWARTSASVILVDAELHASAMHRALGIDGTMGLNNVVPGTISLDEALVPTAVPGLTALPAGVSSQEPATVLRSPRVGEIFNELRERADIIIIDSPPVLPISDPLLLTQMSDVAVLVAEYGATKRSSLRDAAELLLNADTRILGAVFNKARGGDRARYGDYLGTYGTAARQARKDWLRVPLRWLRVRKSK